MIVWILKAIIDIVFNIIAYITNPIVLLFADEYGNLPAIFKWWANWDDHLDVDWMVYEHHVLKIFEYDFNRHYKYHSEWEALETIGEFRGYVDLLDPNFTIKERIQRYFCRLTWLYRNCAYGFSYYVTGVNVDGDKLIDKNPPVYMNGQKLNIRYYKNWWFKDPFVVYGMIRWNPKDVSWLKWTGIDHQFIFKIFLGWKCHSVDPGEKTRCMLVLFAWPFK